MAISGLTLGAQRDLTNDMLVKGIIDSIVTVNQFYQHLPFKGIQGNALAYNRETSGKDPQSLVSVLRTGVSGINKSQMTHTRHSTELTTIIGDAQVNGLVQAVGSDYNDATAVQVAAKAKGVGRKFMDLMINGQESTVARGIVADPQLIAGTPALTATSTPITAAEFYEVVVQGAILSSTANATPKFDLSGAGADGIVLTVASLVTNAGTSAAATTMNGVIVNGKVFTGPFTAAANTAVACTLTASGTSLFNACITLINGPLGFDGLSRFCTLEGRNLTGGKITLTAATAEDLLARLDGYIDAIHDKDGMVDYIMMNSAGVRKYTSALRLSGAAGFDDVSEVKNSSGGVMKVQSYRGVPIYRNDFIDSSIADQATAAGGNDGAGDNPNSVYVGTIDDGSFSHGVTGLTAQNSSGIQIAKLGAREDVDADITRVKWYVGMANFSALGIAKGSI